MAFLSYDVFDLKNKDYAFFVLDCACDLLCWADLVVRFRVLGRRRRFVVADGIFKTKEKHRVSWCMFFTDLLSTLPYDIVAGAMGVTNVSVFRLPRLLRAVRVSSQMKVVSDVLEQKRVLVNHGFHRMLQLWVGFALTSHCFGCGFFGLARKEAAMNQPTWAENDGLFFRSGENGTIVDLKPVIHQYIRSWYWSTITMVTVGLGDIVPDQLSIMESAYTILTMYVGCLFTCVVIGNLTNLVVSLDAAEDEYHAKMDNLNKYMEYRHLGGGLRERIRAYYAYIWNSLRGMDETEFLRKLPAPLRLQVAGLRSRDLLNQISFFKKSKESFINSLCFALEQLVTSPGDNIVVKDQSVHGLHFISRGEAEMLAARGNSVQQTLSGQFGSFFGEESLFFPCVHKNTIRAKSYCELLYLPADKFARICETNLSKEERDTMKAKAEKARKRDQKVKKFFGLDADSGPQKKTWKRHFEPDSNFRVAWNLALLAGVLVQAFAIPLRLAFNVTYTGNWFGSYIPDWIIDLIFIVDIFFKCRLFAFNMEGILIKDKSRIFQRYRKRGFLYDVLASFPLDLLAIVLGGTYLPALRMNKVFRFVNLPKYFIVLQHYLASRRINLSNAFYRLFKIFLAVVLFVHWLGCGWMLMGLRTQKRYSDCEEDFYSAAANVTNSSTIGRWLNMDWGASLGANATLLEACGDACQDWICYDLSASWKTFGADLAMTYLRSVYFVVVDTTTVGYGDVVPLNTDETAYALVITLFGGFMYPAVVGAMAALISNLNSAKNNFNLKVVMLNEYMDLKAFPKALRLRITRYYDYMWSRQRGVDEDIILNDLPSPLRMEVQMFVNGAIIRSIPFFQNVEEDLMRRLLSILRPAVFLPGDYIIKQGEFGQEMFLLERGATRVTSPDGKLTYAVLTQGDYFGEGCLLKAEKRSAAIKAMGYCDCFVLNREDFERVSEGFPSCRALMTQELQNTLSSKKSQNAKVMSNFKQYPKLGQTTSMKQSVGKVVPPSSFRHPESRKRVFWMALLFLATFFNALAIPIRIMFVAVPVTFALDYALDLIFIADFIMQSRYFGFVKDGEVYTDADDIKKHFKTRRMRWIDFITIIPFEFIALAVYLAIPENSQAWILAMSLTRIPKLGRCWRLNEYKNGLVDVLLSAKVVSRTVVKLLVLFIGVIFVSHYAACVFYMLANYHWYSPLDDSSACDVGHGPIAVSSIGGDCPLGSLLCRTDADAFPSTCHSFEDNVCTQESMTRAELDGFLGNTSTFCATQTCGYSLASECKWNSTWIQLQMEWGLLPSWGGSYMSQYLRALNWAIPTLVVVVIGDVVPVGSSDTLLVTICIIFGVVVNAAIIGNIANLVANLEGAKAVFREKADEIEKFLHTYKLPPSLKRRARHYYQYVWETQKGYNQQTIIDDLPSTLRQEVSSFLKLRFVSMCPFFEFCDHALAKALAYSLKSRVYSPGDVVVHEGELGREMFFIQSGTVEMISASDILGESPGSGSMYGSRKYSTFDREKIMSALRKDSRGSIVQQKYTILSTAGEGQFFGETALFFSQRRTCTVRAIEYCELYSLGKENLDALLTRYPFERERMFQVVAEIQRENERRNTHVIDNFSKYVTEGKKLFEFFKTSTEVYVRQRRPKKLIMPTSYFTKVWNIVYAFAVLFQIFSIPYCIAFFIPGHKPLNDKGWTPVVLIFFAVSFAVDAFFLVDMYLRTFHFTFRNKGKIVTRGREIWNRYKRTRFKVDLIASLPLELAILLFPSDQRTVSTLTALRVLHMLRVVHWDDIIDLLETYLQAAKIRFMSSTLQVFRMIVLLLTINHWYACTWFIIHRYVENDRHNTWAIVDNMASYDPKTGTHNILNADKNPFFAYVRAFYFVITTLSTVGYGDIRPYTDLETCFELVVVVSGACVFAGIIGSCAVVFFHADNSGEVAHKANMRKLQQYMRYRELPDDLREQILRHFASLWEKERGVPMREILDQLPIPMRLDIAYCVHKHVLRSIKPLKDCRKMIQQTIALSLQTQRASAGEWIYKSGDLGNEVYFIFYGEVNVLEGKGKLKKSLASGAYFGEETLLSLSGERLCSVQCVTDCELYYLHKSCVENVLMDHPEDTGKGFLSQMIRLKKAKRNADLTASGGKTAPKKLSPMEYFEMMLKQQGIKSMISTKGNKQTSLGTETLDVKAHRRKFSLVKMDSRATIMAVKKRQAEKNRSKLATPSAMLTEEEIQKQKIEEIFADIPSKSLERSMSVGNIVVPYLSSAFERQIIEFEDDDSIDSDGEEDGTMAVSFSVKARKNSNGRLTPVGDAVAAGGNESAIPKNKLLSRIAGKGRIARTNTEIGGRLGPKKSKAVKKKRRSPKASKSPAVSMTCLVNDSGDVL